MKKASMPLNYVITAIILLIVLFVILFTFTDLFKKEKAALDDSITSVTGDWDCDGIYDFYDKCPCDSDMDRVDSKCDGKNPKWCAGQKAQVC